MRSGAPASNFGNTISPHRAGACGATRSGDGRSMVLAEVRIVPAAPKAVSASILPAASPLMTIARGNPTTVPPSTSTTTSSERYRNPLATNQAASDVLPEPVGPARSIARPFALTAPAWRTTALAMSTMSACTTSS